MKTRHQLHMESSKYFIVIFLVDNFQRSDSSGWTPLHFAIQENRQDVAEYDTIFYCLFRISL